MEDVLDVSTENLRQLKEDAAQVEPETLDAVDPDFL